MSEKKTKEYDYKKDNDEEMRLFPDFLPGSTASATESTGLIQVGILADNAQNRYDDVYSYRQTKVYDEKD